MSRARPAGFTFLSVCALLCACGMAFGLASVDVGPAERFALAATGALGLVTAEALALVRPWAFRASLAFAASFFAMAFVTTGNLDDFLVVTTFVTLPIAIALSFVYNGLRAVGAITPGPQRIRVPAPRP